MTWGIQWVLFAILGWMAFGDGGGKLVWTIVFIVLMLLWLVGGLGDFKIGDYRFR